MGVWRMEQCAHTEDMWTYGIVFYCSPSKHFGVKDGKGRRGVAYNSYKMNGIPCSKKCHN